MQLKREGCRARQPHHAGRPDGDRRHRSRGPVVVSFGGGFGGGPFARRPTEKPRRSGDDGGR